MAQIVQEGHYHPTVSVAITNIYFPPTGDDRYHSPLSSCEVLGPMQNQEIRPYFLSLLKIMECLEIFVVCNE